MMNKKILLSVAAAATISTLLTGCGSSSSSSSDTATTGVAQKAALIGSTVNIGGATATTIAGGAYTVTNAVGTEIEVSGGYMDMPEGVDDVNNTMVLKSVISADNPNNVVSMATTLIVELVNNGTSQEDAETITMNLLGLDATGLFTAPDALEADSEADLNVLKNRQANVWAMLSAVQSSDEGMRGLSANLEQYNVVGETVSINDFADALDDAMDSAVNAVATAGGTLDLTAVRASIVVQASAENLVKQEEAVLFAASTNSVAAPVEAAFTNVLNLDTSNYVFETHGMIDTNHNLSYTAVSDINLQEPSMFDGDDLHPASADLYFSLVDLTTVAPTGETGTMTIEMKDLNGNASYKMSLSNLTVTSATSAEDDNNYVTLGMNENVSVSLSAISDMNVSTHFSNSDLNITALCETNLIDSEEDGIELNLATFARYVRLNAEEDSSETNGNFSSAMVGNGNYSIKVNADLNGKQITYGSGIDAFTKATITKTTVDGVEYTGYKILDANLNK